MPQETTGEAAPIRSGRRPRWSPVALATAAPGPVLPWRAAGAVALLACGAVHGYLYDADAYRAIPTVGPLFLATVVTAGVLATAVLAIRRPLADLLAAVFALSVLGGYCLVLLLPQGLFLFEEPSVSAAGAVSILAEVAAPLALVAAARRSLADPGVTTGHL